MKAIQIHQRHSSLINLPLPVLQDHEILLKTYACGICGTDILKINQNSLTVPTVLGHEVVGEVCALGSAVDGIGLGDRVVVAHHVPCFECHFCRHGQETMCVIFKKTNIIPGGFAEYIAISAEHVKHTTFVLPAAMSFEEALFTEPLACCVRNIDRLPLLAQDTVVVVGLGSIGLMMAQLLRLNGCHVIGLDTDASRCEVAKSYGVTSAFCAADGDFLSCLNQQTQQRRADGVILTAGPATLFAQALTWVRDGGFVNLFSHLSGEVAVLDTKQFYHRELQLITTYSATPASLRKAFHLLQHHDLNLRQMLAPSYPPHLFDSAVDDIQQRRVLKAMIRF